MATPLTLSTVEYQPRWLEFTRFHTGSFALRNDCFCRSRPLKPRGILYWHHWWVSAKSQHDCCTSSGLLLPSPWTKETTLISANDTIFVWHLLSPKRLFLAQQSAETLGDSLLTPLMSLYQISARLLHIKRITAAESMDQKDNPD